MFDLQFYFPLICVFMYQWLTDCWGFHYSQFITSLKPSENLEKFLYAKDKAENQCWMAVITGPSGSTTATSSAEQMFWKRRERHPMSYEEVNPYRAASVPFHRGQLQASLCKHRRDPTLTPDLFRFMWKWSFSFSFPVDFYTDSQVICCPAGN